jgi:hypothetical protein
MLTSYVIFTDFTESGVTFERLTNPETKFRALCIDGNLNRNTLNAVQSREWNSEVNINDHYLRHTASNTIILPSYVPQTCYLTRKDKQFYIGT